MLGLNLDGSNINLLVALAAGFVTFFASCLLPLVPTYLGYLSGVALTSDDAGKQRWLIVKTSLFFVFGFIATFVILGLTLNHLSSYVSAYRAFFEKIFGLLFIILGLFMLGVFKHQAFSQERKINFNSFFIKSRSIQSVLAGVAFGFAWTPCIGPVLAVILYWSVQAETTWKGISLLIAYGIGLGIPFVIVAMAFEKVIPWLKKHKKVADYASKIAAGLVILAGILMLTGHFQETSKYIMNTFSLSIFAK